MYKQLCEEINSSYVIELRAVPIKYPMYYGLFDTEYEILIDRYKMHRIVPDIRIVLISKYGDFSIIKMSSLFQFHRYGKYDFEYSYRTYVSPKYYYEGLELFKSRLRKTYKKIRNKQYGPNIRISKGIMNNGL